MVPAPDAQYKRPSPDEHSPNLLAGFSGLFWEIGEALNTRGGSNGFLFPALATGELPGCSDGPVPLPLLPFEQPDDKASNIATIATRFFETTLATLYPRQLPIRQCEPHYVQR